MSTLAVLFGAHPFRKWSKRPYQVFIKKRHIYHLGSIKRSRRAATYAPLHIPETLRVLPTGSRYGAVMRLVWKTIESAPYNWRSIAKALILVDHLIKNGAEKVVGDVQQHIHDIIALKEFMYQEGGFDRGSGGAPGFRIDIS